MKFKVQGGKKLKGEVSIKGAKNAALKIIPAAILASSSLVIKNVPKISDVDKLIEILVSIGAKSNFRNGEVRSMPQQ